MRYFDFLDKEKTEQIFYIPPGDFDKYTEKDLLENALGALLYFPAIKDGLINFIQTNSDVKSIVFCLEDAIGDNLVWQAQKNLLLQLKELKELDSSSTIRSLPLMFIRVRSPEHLHKIGQEFVEVLDLLTGFIFPKFDTKVADSYFQIFNRIKNSCVTPLYACPILEGPEIIERENRLSSLQYLKNILDNNKESVLNIRIGATDFLGLYRLRRQVNFTIYDISIMKDCIGDIVNFFCRKESPYVVSGGVWEFFPDAELVKKLSPKELLQHPTQKKLVEEVQLDMFNGLWGKTAIHPSQLFPIQSNYIISFENYQDALDIISDHCSVHGATNSKFANKMNEYKPHRHWANKILTRARIYGVFNKNVNYEHLFNA
jgi:citrate lyase beta subunit